MIYFDNSATTPMNDTTIDTMVKVQKQFIGNPSSLHQLGVNAHQLMEKARQQIKNLLSVEQEDIIWTSGGTESNNTAILGSVATRQGRHIITSSIEHPSVMNTMAFLETLGYDVTYLKVDENGVICIEDVKRAITKQTCLVSLMWVNNEVGAIQPIEQVGQLLQDYPTIYFHVDAVQALHQVTTQGIPNRVDLLSLSAHKFHGPRGVGILYKKKNRQLQPYLHGGGQEKGFRSGTENVAGIVATSRALREYGEKDSQIVDVSTAFRQVLEKFEKVVILSSEQGAHHIITFALPNVRGEVMVHALEEHDIYISTTSACSSKLNKKHHTLGAMGISNDISQCAVRVSFSKWNTLEEVQYFEKVFEQVYTQFQKVMK